MPDTLTTGYLGKYFITTFVIKETTLLEQQSKEKTYLLGEVKKNQSYDLEDEEWLEELEGVDVQPGLHIPATQLRNMQNL